MRTIRYLIAISAVLCSLTASRSAALFFSLDFSLDNQTYNWTDSLLYTRDLGQENSLQLWNRSKATLIKKSVFGEDEDRWQKSARTAAVFKRNLNDHVTTGLEVRQNFERLEKRRYIGNSAYLLGNLSLGSLVVKQQGGVVWEEREYAQEKSTQSGFGYESSISFLPRRDGGLGSVVLEGNFTTLRRTPRKNIKLGYDLTGSFTGTDTTALHASQAYGETRYFPTSSEFGATARQRSDQRELDFELRRVMPAAVYLRARSSYRLSSYRYEFEKVRDDLIRQNDNMRSLFEYRVDLGRVFGEYLKLDCEYLFSRSKEDFGAAQLNQKSETGQLAITMQLTLLEADTIEASGKKGVTSYTSPSYSEIFSDRDRTIELASLRLTHRFTEFLRASIDGSYRGFHTIYISGSLSANNNVNNVYILNPSLIWQPWSHITIEQDYQMHADYIYYDYEKSSLTGRNTIYRRANFSNRLIIAASPRTRLTFEYSYRYEDFGPIRFTDQWQQQISWDRRTHRPRFALDYRPTPSFRFQPYAVYEIQTSYDHLFDPDIILGTREQSEEFVRTLIGFELEWRLSQASYVECKLERRVQEYQRQRNQDYDLFTIALKKYL